MYEISRERVFAASHQLRGYSGRCERLHGHNWRVRIHLAAAALDAVGMVVDFHELDRVLGEVLAPFEHAHLNDVAPFDRINPSSENLARVIAEAVAGRLDDDRVRVVRCEVWENDQSRASYQVPAAV